ncbi:MAG: dTDP-glucose 4,6-dehydratase [Chloroflexota bacterium]
MRVLVTGGAGFIGSNFVRFVLREHSDWQVTNLDKLTYAGNPENLADVSGDPRYTFVKGDIVDRDLVRQLLASNFDLIVNFAAESHVDRSIRDSSLFIETNVKGTHVLLEEARHAGVSRFLQVSTDEVYGSLGPTGKFVEESPIEPNSPYAASKAAADMLCRVFWHTYGTPVLITRCGNNLGPYQFPEKFIPLAVSNVLEGKPIPIYGDGRHVRDWIYVEDHCRALDLVAREGQPGEVYNIGGDSERANIDIAKKILEVLGKPESLITYVADRPGHDRRYALDTSKIQRTLGWRCRYSFEAALEKTVTWYLENRSWWQKIKRPEYL